MPTRDWKNDSRVRTRRKIQELLLPHNFHALHAAPANMVLFEADLNAAAKLARGIVLAAGNGTKLQPQRCAGRSEGFNAEHARPVDQDRRPCRIVSQFGGDSFQSSEGFIGRSL